MSEYYNRQWRLPNAWNGTESNVNKQSNYSIYTLQTDYISAPLSIDEFSAATMSVWFKTSASQNHRYFLSFLEAVGANGFDLNFVTSGIRSYLAGHSGGNTLDSTFTYNDGNWHHVIVSYDGTNHKMYIDGVLTASDSASAGTIKNGNGIFYIGAAGAGISAYNTYATNLDQVAVFNYALSDGGVSVGQTATGQIATLYGGGSAMGNPMSLSPNPIAFYNLGDQDSFNGANYLVPNSSLKDYVFSGYPGNTKLINSNINQSNTGGKFTISLWQKYNGSGFATFNHGGSIVGEFRYFSKPIVYLASSCYQYFDIQLTDLTANTNWQHWVIFVDTTNVTNSKFWVDGVSIALAGSSTASSANAFTSGLQINLASYPYISNMMYFTNYEINQANVDVLYNNGAPITSTSGLSTAPDHWYKFNSSDSYDGTNWTITDYVGSSNGTTSGITQTALQQSDLSFKSGYSPYAFAFDGVDDYIDCGTSQLLDFSSSFTISAWVYITSTASGYDCVYAFKGASNAFVMFFNNGSGYSPISFGSANYPTDGTIKCATNVTINKWNNIVVVYNGNGIATPSNYTFYIDNTSQTLTTSGGFSDNGNVNYIGRYASSHSFTGSISNVSVWNTALTSSQVTEIYNEGVPSNLNNHSAYTNLVSWWQLGSNSSFNTNWTVLDEKGSNNGTSSNMTESDIVDGPNYSSGGVSSGMSGDEVIGDAPYSTANALSVNMDVLDRTTDVPS